ncbi:MAG: GNAT family N-acetyltransferase [Moritella sp.]|uniref:GNAT family N-acetyltransferase n=1 Tax=Moritella sp. TaxID=78556 RepID=UPI0025EDE9CA|nr:GNAT family N-acetyltransferase [Moritella sp.]NQZ91500.1 GNAT family N-acetyltransferase [Moritella sp.]
MKLIQLNDIQLKMLIQSGDTPTDLTFIEHSIPPIHVLVRSMDLRYNRVDVIWALPYFIQKHTQIIGACGFKEAPKNSRVEIGYNVAPDARGLGVATSAIKQLSQIAFASAVVDTVFALIASDNKASLNVVQKNGFSFKEFVIDSDGEQLEYWELNKGVS